MADRTPQAEAEQRLHRWMQQYAQPLYGFLVVHVGDRHLAEDLVQEVFCRAWEARDRYDDIGQERAYLWRIADRLVCDRMRARKRQVRVEPASWDAAAEAPAVGGSPADVAEHWENCSQLDTALAALTDAQRRTLLLRYYGQLEFHEIAAMTDTPLNTALSHARRGLALLRRLLVES